MGRRKKQQHQRLTGRLKEPTSAAEAARPEIRSRRRRLTLGVVAALVVVIGSGAVWLIVNGGPDSTSAVVAPSAEAPSPTPTVDTSPIKPVETASGRPQISFAERVHDFGTVAQGSKPSHTFVFRNTGDVVLKVISARGT